MCVSKVMIFISDKCLSVHNCDQFGAYLISEVIYIMSRRITLYDVVYHHEFGDDGWKSIKSQRELKLKFGNILEKLSGHRVTTRKVKKIFS